MYCTPTIRRARGTTQQARDNFATGIDVYSGMYETVEQMIAVAP